MVDRSKSPIRMILHAVSLDDEVIKHQISQADQLLNRVKKALVRIKSIKPCDEFPIGGSSNPTDTEEAINSSSQEGEKDKGFRDGGLKSLQRRSISRSLTCPNANKGHDDDVSKVARPVEIAPTFSLNIEASRNSKECCSKYRFNRADIDFKRSKTGRTGGGVLSKQLKKGIFRSCRGIKRLEISNCSFKKLQGNFQTISETIESNDSMPRKRNDCSQIIHQLDNKNYTTESLSTDNKDNQMASCLDNTTRACDNCPREQKEIQVTKVPTTDIATDMFNLNLKQSKDTQTTSEMQNLRSQETFSLKPKCSSCNRECLRVIETMPLKYVCHMCEHILKHEDLQERGTVSVGFKAEKLRKLKVQILPPIIIKPTLTVIQTLNLSIDPIGKSKNYVRNTDNLLFVETKRFMENQMPFEAVLLRRAENNVVTEEGPENDEEVNNFLYQNLLKDGLEADTNKEALPVEDALNVATVELPNKIQYQISSNIFDNNKSRNDQIKKMVLSTNSAHKYCTEMEEVVMKDIYSDQEFVNKTRERRQGDRFVEEIVKSFHGDQMQDKEIRRKQPCYKYTYHNPKKHDPNKLAQKSSEKLLEVDSEVYKTFVNPDLKMCEELTASISKYKLMGFESKTVQCDQEMILAAQKSYKPDESNKIIIDLMPSRADDNNAVMEIESEVTALRLLQTVPLEWEISPPDIMHSKIVGSESYLEKNESSSPSEITLPITYSLSLEKKIDGNIPMNDAINADIDNILTSCDSEGFITSDVGSKATSKVIRVKDQKVIDKLQEKYRSIELNDSTPNFRITKRDEFSSDSNKLFKTENERTIHYWWNKPVFQDRYGGQLQLDFNGRYTDNEHPFTQMPYSTAITPHKKLADTKYLKPRSFQDRDLQGTNDTFAVIPRHQLRSYSLDIYNSDTVATNSISEGEVLCKHDVSNGEIHVCHQMSQCPRLERNILTRKPNSLHRKFLQNFSSSSSKKNDVTDCKLSVQQRRNCFNNWVTYYMKPHDINDSTTSSCSNNK